MKRSFTSTGVVNTLSFVRDAILSSSGDGGHMQKVGSWKDVLRLTHSVGLTLLGAGTIGALLLLRQVSPGAALSWILQTRPPHGPPDPSSIDPSHLTVPGLRNIGNNCFLNAILQALASSGVLLSFLASYDRESILSLFHGIESRCAPLPLTEALSDLLVELSELDSEPRVTSPRHVMRALEPYAKQFDLSLQQDAAEALTYLTSALHEERVAFFKSFRAYRESISDASRTCTNGGCLMGTVIDNACGMESSPLLSWNHQLRWPMEGTIASMLTCKECGFQFSTQFQSLHEVPLSPPQLPDGNIVSGCNLEACLEQFTAPECITNVKCSYCSHSLALRLLQTRDGLDKALLQRVKDCTFDDDCACEKLVTEAGGLWRNVYVNAVKQLRLGRCPEVMCCQVQRAVVNKSGELVKWTGHVSFPFILNLSPYVMSTQGCPVEMCSSVSKSPVQSLGHADVLQKYLWPKRSFEMQSNVEFDSSRVPSSTDGSSSDDAHLSGSEDLASDTSSESMIARSGDDTVYKHEGAELPQSDTINPTGCGDLKMYGLDSVLFSSPSQNLMPLDDREKLLFRFQELGDRASFFGPCSQMAYNPLLNFSTSQGSSGRSLTTSASANAQWKNKLFNEVRQDGLCDSGRWLYELISVVVHHGSPRNGHYTVYRKAKLKVNRSTEAENKSDMLQDDITNLDRCTSDAMAVDESNPGGCDEEMRAAVDSSSENVSENISNDTECSKDVVPVETFSGPSDVSSGRESNGNDSSVPLSLECDQNVKVKAGACIEALRDGKLNQAHQEEIVLWFRVSDSHVDLVTEEEVMMAQATLLFYEQLM